jgi:hypothetical protein
MTLQRQICPTYRQFLSIHPLLPVGKKRYLEKFERKFGPVD